MLKTSIADQTHLSPDLGKFEILQLERIVAAVAIKSHKETQPSSQMKTSRSNPLSQIGVHLSGKAKETPRVISAEQAENEIAATFGRWSDSMYDAWDEFLDQLEESPNDSIKWISRNFLRRISMEAPIVVTFVFLCVVLHVLNMTLLPGISFFFGIDDTFQWSNPLQYVRFITHIFGHTGMGHLRGNMTNILLVGPSAEAAFGSKGIVQVIILVAFSSGVAHILIGRANSRQLGASGVVFALILLNSLISARSGRIPLSFVMTAMLWMGDELWKLFFAGDATSHHAHLTGGIVGTMGGYWMHQQRERERLKRVANTWKMSASRKAK